MLIRPEDLEELIGGGGEPLERCVYALVSADARRLGRHPADVRWDHRVAVPDGGSDLVVDIAHDQPVRVIPKTKSIWSVKSGENGTAVATFRNEISGESRERVLERIKDGWSYVWVSPRAASQERRYTFEAAANGLAAELGVPPGRFIFIWADALTEMLRGVPNVCARHLPVAWSRCSGISTVERWLAQPEGRAEHPATWIPMGGRDELGAAIAAHLLGRDGTAVLHIAGLSGVGKTRSVLQACMDSEDLRSTLYVPRFGELAAQFVSQLEAETNFVRIVVDEVPLGDFEQLSARLEGQGHKIRMLTVGTARNGERRGRSRPDLRLVEPPSEEADMLEFVRSVGAGLPDRTLVEITEASWRDLRLARLLVEATRRAPEARPLHDVEGVWERLASRYPAVRDREFQDNYAYLTTVMDIECDSMHSEELRQLAEFFKVPASDLWRSLVTAQECGLGDNTRRYFEARPRGLASWIFRDRLVPLLRGSFGNLIRDGVGGRLRRRLLERCQDLPESERREVLAEISPAYRMRFGEPSLAAIAQVELAREFCVWTESDPAEGLAWLDAAMENASDEDVRSLGGYPYGTTGYGGRRHIVWLLESLACFGEHFRTCERTLFRLAQVETEARVGGNSTEVWRALFLAVGSFSELAFDERANILLRRLEAGDERTLDLVASAAVGVLCSWRSRRVPAEVVGGNLLPPAWLPASQDECDRLRQAFGRSFLQQTLNLKNAHRDRVFGRLAVEIGRFHRIGLLNELRDAFAAVDAPAIVDALREAVDRELHAVEIWACSDRLSPEGREHAEESCRILREWRTSITATALDERVRDLTRREFWSVADTHAEGDPTRASAVYSELAIALIEEPDVLRGLHGWLGSPECRSGYMLGKAVGSELGCTAIEAIVRSWMESGVGLPFLAGYLGAVAARLGGLPMGWSELLCQIAEVRPDAAARLCFESDVSARGAEMLIGLIPRLEGQSLRGMLTWGHPPWRDALTWELKTRAVGCLVDHAPNSADGAAAVALRLIAAWAEEPGVALPPEMRDYAIRILAHEPIEDPSDLQLWSLVASALCQSDPADMIGLLASTLTGHRGRWSGRVDEARGLLIELATRMPEAVLERVGPLVVADSPEERIASDRLRGLFDVIPLALVEGWIRQRGLEAALAVARTAAEPRFDREGALVVPPLADWLLTNYELEPRVLQAFLRRQGIRWFTADDFDVVEARRIELASCASDRRSWLREWARLELAIINDASERQRQRRDEWHRR